MSDYLPIELVRYAADKLEELRSEVVFLGGAVVGLLITEPGARPPRPTKDVDVTVEVSTLTDFYALDNALLSKGFVNDMSGPMGRYLHGLIKLDVMPVNSGVLGVTNRWYALAIGTSQTYALEGGMVIRLVAAPCFLATKMEAFGDPKREGHNDIFVSRDFGDAIRVIDGRSSTVNEVLSAPAELCEFLRERFLRILEENYLEEAIAEHADPGREDLVMERLKSLASPI